MYVDDEKFNVQTGKAEDATEAARNVYEELKKQMNMISMKPSSDECMDDARHESVLGKRKTRLNLQCEALRRRSKK